MFPKVKPFKSHVPHNGGGIIGAVEHLDDMRESGFPRPANMTPPHPARFRKRI